MFTANLGHFMPRDREVVSATLKVRGCLKLGASEKVLRRIRNIIRHSGMRRQAQARNPYSRWWLWIPGSLASLAPRNDGH